MEKIENFIKGKWTTSSGQEAVLKDAVTGEAFSSLILNGIDFSEALDYARKVGNPKLRNLTFFQRGKMLKRLALHLTQKKDHFYDLSYRTGATKSDSWIDIEGGFGNLFVNASLRRTLPNLPYLVEGEAIDISRGEGFMGHHIMVPKEGVAIHINAFNFPVWGMLEKCAVNWMAGMPAIVKPAIPSAFLTEAVVKEIIASGILPDGALQLICGTGEGILDAVNSQDVVTFTGSASTGKLLRAHPRIIAEAVPFNMEADSLNCAVLGEDALPGGPEFDLFIKEVTREITVKCGQKCTAIRRVLVPEELIEEVQSSLVKSLKNVTIGNPKLKEVRMGTLVSKDQLEEVRQNLHKLAKTSSIVYGDPEEVQVLGADAKAGAFISPILLRENLPHQNLSVHEVEVFGPVATLMPYKNIDEAVQLSRLGKGSLCCSIATNDREISKAFVLGAAPNHGRILILNRQSAAKSTGHGSPLPTLVHGGPGRAGGGEEMGGIRGIKHYLQRCAIQGSPDDLSNITQTYLPGTGYKPSPLHPFQYHFEDLEIGQSIATHKRTITDTDIINFANLSWDHFYAHTDVTALEGTIFERRTAHGYFILSAAAGLFVYPHKSPVSANYGLEDCRFIKPLYHGDTIYVRFTCKEKMERDAKGKEIPSGIVKWYVEIFDQHDELAALATILTLVNKKSPFIEINRKNIEEILSRLSPDAKAKWGLMTPQHMVEHLAYHLKIATNQIIHKPATPDHLIEKYQEFLWSHKPIPKNYPYPELRKGETEDLVHKDLETAKEALLQAYDHFLEFFEDNPETKTVNAVYGDLSKFEWNLLNRKHMYHHFQQFNLIND